MNGPLKTPRLSVLSYLILSTVFSLGCTQVEEKPTQNTPNSVDAWTGVWVGAQPERPLNNSNGEPIVIRGKTAVVKGSLFTFTIQENGTATLQQNFEDGRAMSFAGTWKGQIDERHNIASPSPSESVQLSAVVCDLAAIDTGAYRQYVLVADKETNQVMCIGNSGEPTFPMKHVSAL
jgi:hypothetical protein